MTDALPETAQNSERREFADVETLAIFYDAKRLDGPDGWRDRQIVLALNVASGVASVCPLQATNPKPYTLFFKSTK